MTTIVVAQYLGSIFRLNIEIGDALAAGRKFEIKQPFKNICKFKKSQMNVFRIHTFSETCYSCDQLHGLKSLQEHEDHARTVAY